MRCSCVLAERKCSNCIYALMSQLLLKPASSLCSFLGSRPESSHPFNAITNLQSPFSHDDLCHIPHRWVQCERDSTCSQANQSMWSTRPPQITRCNRQFESHFWTRRAELETFREKRLMRTVTFRRWQCDLPGGAMDREIVDLLSEEVSILSRGEAKLEWLIVFMVVMMHRVDLKQHVESILRNLRYLSCQVAT